MRLIGLAGHKRAGKDTAAQVLQRQGWKATSFAEPIREFIHQLVGPDSFEEKEQETFFGKSPRQMMQTLGTEWGRNLVNPDIWVMVVAERYKRLRERDPRFGYSGMVVTDVRFPNEVDWIRSQGGFVFQISRPESMTVDAHESENALGMGFTPDFHIINSGTIEELHDTVLLFESMAYTAHNIHSQG